MKMEEVPSKLVWPMQQNKTLVLTTCSEENESDKILGYRTCSLSGSLTLVGLSVSAWLLFRTAALFARFGHSSLYLAFAQNIYLYCALEKNKIVSYFLKEIKHKK